MSALCSQFSELFCWFTIRAYPHNRPRVGTWSKSLISFERGKKRSEFQNKYFFFVHLTKMYHNYECIRTAWLLQTNPNLFELCVSACAATALNTKQSHSTNSCHVGKFHQKDPFKEHAAKSTLKPTNKREIKKWCAQLSRENNTIIRVHRLVHY